MIGGYQIVNLQGADFTLNAAVVVEGVYNTIANGNYKAILIEDFSIGGVKQYAGFAAVEIGTNAFNLAIGDYLFTVTNMDSVTVAYTATPAIAKTTSTKTTSTK